ncbi:Starch-binding associating with outer membrane [Draconibacterium orientale]|nr:Starch-binding associating with outer membrane [Draconibacterium orientale]
MVSCDLDRLPETTFSDSAFWKTETDLRGANTRLYNQLGGYSHDTRSDELVRVSQDGISSGNWTVPSTSGSWSNPYKAIFTANNIIGKAVNAELSEAIINRWLAEAYFFRAYFYFDLVKKYGDVPLILKAIDDTNDELLYSARTPREEVIQQCYDDLDFAADWLPEIDELTGADWGRVSRSAAQALKVRVGLYEGTFSKYHNLGSNYQSHLQEAVSAAEAIITEDKHSLYPDFQNLFLFDGEGRQNKENIFVKVYGPNGEGTVTHNNSRQMENTVSVTRQMVDMFLYSDGLPMGKTTMRVSPETSFDDVFENRDPRLSMTVYKLGEEAYKGPYVPFENQHGYGYSLKKGFLVSEWETNSRETIDKMLIRYAEVLISYAEALYELNGSISDAQLDLTVNALRERVGFDARLTNAFVTGNNLSMLDEIRRERGIELLDEGFRYNDIIRWKIAEDVLPKAIIGAKYVESETSKARVDIDNRLTDANGMLDGEQAYDQVDMYVIEKAGDRNFDPQRDYLYPVPLNEISLSGGAVIQNPEWE